MAAPSIRTEDVAAIIQDYTEDSTIYPPNGPVKGLESIRSLFDAFFAGPFAEVQSLEILRQGYDGKFAYLFWKAETAAVKIPVATDTFIIRGEKKDGQPKCRGAHHPQGVNETGILFVDEKYNVPFLISSDLSSTWS